MKSCTDSKEDIGIIGNDRTCIKLTVYDYDR